MKKEPTSNRADRRAISTSILASLIVVAVAGVSIIRASSLCGVIRDEMAENDVIIEQLRMHEGVPVQEALEARKSRFVSLQSEWEQVRAITDTFQDRATIAYGAGIEEEARIDFKIALFEARERLQALAKAKGIIIPQDLGIAEEISTGEQTDTRLWQLAAVVMLVERLVELGVTDISDIEALPSVIHPLLEKENSVAEEYGVDVTFVTSFDKLPRCVMLPVGQGRLFALRRFATQRAGSSRDGALTIDAVYGSTVYRLRNDGEPVLVGRGGGDG
jgi:hypothetical protein